MKQVVNIKALESKVDQRMVKMRNKSKFLEAGKVGPINENYPN
jgi:hypothetical protein